MEDAVARLSLEELRDFARKLRCEKIDLEDVMRFRLKEELLAYMVSRKCPGVKMLFDKISKLPIEQ